MRIERRDGGHIERQILAGMITDPQVLARIAQRWDDDLFRGRASNLIGRWCVEHFERYEEAPGRSVQAHYEDWASRKERDRDTLQMVEKFLASLSDEHDQSPQNSAYLLNLAGEYFNEVRRDRLADTIKGHHNDGNRQAAEEAIQNYRRVELGLGAGCDPFLDTALMKSALDPDQNSVTLVEYPGDLGVFFQGLLERDGFISFEGPDKTGKTFWLLDLAYTAMLQGRRVAMFQCGDLSERQFLGRLYVRHCQHPFRSRGSKWPCVVKCPVIIRPPGAKQATADVQYEELTFDKPLDWETAEADCSRLHRKRLKTTQSMFKLSVHPAESVTVNGIRNILGTWELEQGWVPDVVVVDYADLLAPPEGTQKLDERGQIDKSWKQLNRIRQELHCLVVTATQVKATGYKKRILDRSDFSGDKRKRAHVTGTVGLNVSDADKKAGVSRLNWIVLREGEFVAERVVWVAGCLPLACPAVCSTL